MEFKHKSVLLNESIEALNIKKDGIYVDGTLGGGGHSYEILKRLGKDGKLIGIDRDIEAINAANARLGSFENFYAVHDNHDNIIEILKRMNISAVDGILLDLGVSSYQLDEASRGFSYMHDARLDMRMNREDSLSAYEVVNEYSEEALSKIFFDYGEERYSRQIAKNICKKRQEQKIETTFELVDIIKKSIPVKALNEKQHPAKRVFQAIRIEVNDELIKLKQSVIDQIMSLNPGGRLAIITFHSLEDKIVKHTYEEIEGRCTCPKDFPVCVCGYKSYGKIVNKKAIISKKEELDENPRARSAKLRIFERGIEN
ncbi:ribosomal RNA small subunit methyltransferase H [Clostridium sp. CAG:921]|nr:ribosomal RNA small subunit methyltransferase H [Clostridium sp. CAG:921]